MLKSIRALMCVMFIALAPNPPHDGVYKLVSVDGRPLPYNMISIDSRNRLVLTKGIWTLNGTALTTEMYTTSVVKGTATSEARYNPERHAARLTVSGDTASGMLDSGSPVTLAFAGSGMTTRYNGRQLRFEKL